MKKKNPYDLSQITTDIITLHKKGDPMVEKFKKHHKIQLTVLKSRNK